MPLCLIEVMRVHKYNYVDLECVQFTCHLILGIKIKFLGEAKTEWTESQSVKNEETGKTEERRNEVTGNEEYYQITYYLMGGVNSAETELPAGAHSFPFTCALPPQLPSSFEGEFGHVRYTIKVTLGEN